MLKSNYNQSFYSRKNSDQQNLQKINETKQQHNNTNTSYYVPKVSKKKSIPYINDSIRQASQTDTSLRSINEYGFAKKQKTKHINPNNISINNRTHTSYKTMDTFRNVNNNANQNNITQDTFFRVNTEPDSQEIRSLSSNQKTLMNTSQKRANQTTGFSQYSRDTSSKKKEDYQLSQLNLSKDTIQFTERTVQKKRSQPHINQSLSPINNLKLKKQAMSQQYFLGLSKSTSKTPDMKLKTSFSKSHANQTLSPQKNNQSDWQKNLSSQQQLQMPKSYSQLSMTKSSLNLQKMTSIKSQVKTMKDKMNNSSRKQEQDPSKNEYFSIYGNQQAIEFQQKKSIFQQLQRYKYAQKIIDFLRFECKKHLNENSIDFQRESTRARIDLNKKLETNLEIMKNMIPLIQSGLQVKYYRNQMDKIMTEIVSLAKKSGNTFLHAYTLYNYGKMQYVWNNYQKAIELFKQVKNSLNNKLTIRLKMKSYKRLGQCFSTIKRFELSLLYYGKFLRFAWYLNDVDQELNAYDYIGVQFYYQGKLNQAKYFHSKMINGIHEDKNSDLRKLGVSKVKNHISKKNGGTHSQMQNIFKRQKKADKFDQFIVSSSEDEFDIPIHGEVIDKEEGSKEDIDELKKYNPYEGSEQNFQVKEIKKFSVQENLYQKEHYQMSRDSANSNIRMVGNWYRKIEHQRKQNLTKESDFSQLSSTRPVGDGSKQLLRFSHQSINRNIDNYHRVDGRMPLVDKEKFNSKIYDQFEKQPKQKVVRIYNKFLNNIMYSISQMEYLLKQEQSNGFSSQSNLKYHLNNNNNHSSKMKRKTGFLLINKFKEDKTTYQQAYIEKENSDISESSESELEEKSPEKEKKYSKKLKNQQKFASQQEIETQNSKNIDQDLQQQFFDKLNLPDYKMATKTKKTNN